MPLVRLSLLRGKSKDQIRAIADNVHQALIETFEVPSDDRFQFVDQYEPEEFIYDPGYLGVARSDSVIFIQIFLSAGRTTEQKQALYARIAALLPPPVRPRYLVWMYGIEVWRPLSGSRSRALRQATVRLATSSHTVVEARAVNRDFGPVEVLPLCLEERAPAGEVDGTLLDRAGHGFLLIVGRMAASERYKGHDQLLQAMTRLPSAGHARPRLIIAGDGDDRRRLEALSASLGLSGEVLFTGFVSEATLAELYARAAVFVMPSRGEGFGLVYLEAMRAGRPCVAARASAAAEIVADGETGLLVDPLDPEAIAGALGRLLAAPNLARAMGEAGRRRLERQFTPRRFRERLWPLLDRLTGGPEGTGDRPSG